MAESRRPGQAELIITAEQSGQMQVPDFYANPETAAVSVPERYIHLQNAITYLAAVSMRAGFIKADNAAIYSGRQHAPSPMRKGVEGNRAKFAKLAEASFVKASGNEALLAAGLVASEAELKSMNRQMFSDFMKEYYGDRNYKKAQAYRRQLAVNNIAFHTAAQTKKNRAEGKRPHAPKPQAAPQTMVAATEQKEPKPLATPFRLRAIAEDPRAGFLPTTNREKNQVLAFLDYLDNSDYPFGVNNQFLEVFSRAQKIRRKKPDIDSKRGPESITYEFGDYLANATSQLIALEALEPILMEAPNKKVTLGDEQEWIDLTMPGFASLVQYRDLVEFRKNGSLPHVKDPLLTKEDRWTRQGPGKHKIIEDRYTARERSEAIKKYIARSIEQMTVGEAQSLLSLAISNQIKRQAFMQVRLKEIATPTDQMQGAAREVLLPASDAAMQILGELQAV